MDEWERDTVATVDGVRIPVRETAQRPIWSDVPAATRSFIERRIGGEVADSWSAGTGFTPGFASRLDLSDGRRVFVKAASSADDRLHGWGLSDAYREEVRKLAALPDGIGAPPLRWHDDIEIDGETWVIAGFDWIDGRPPRRPWRHGQLELVLTRLASTVTALTPPPSGLDLEPVGEHLVAGWEQRLEEAALEVPADGRWVDQLAPWCKRAELLAAGSSLVHMDLRDDNILIDARDDVWFVDWNWPVVGAAWIDLVCLLLSARGDGHDVEALLATHELSRDADPDAITAVLAVLWSYWAASVQKETPHGSPYLRIHQRWYLDVTRGWLTDRLGQM